MVVQSLCSNGISTRLGVTKANGASAWNSVIRILELKRQPERRRAVLWVATWRGGANNSNVSGGRFVHPNSSRCNC